MSTSKIFVPTIQNRSFATSIVQSLDALSLARDEWEKNAFKKANEGLYDLLGKCHDTYLTKFVNADKGDMKTLRSELVERLTYMGVRCTKQSTTLTLLVRFVFACDRNRASTYGKVIAAAVQANVAPSMLPAWIADKKGIEEIKKENLISEEAKERQQKREVAKMTAEGQIKEAEINPLATVSIDGFTASKQSILLCAGNGNGDFNVTYVLTEVPESLFKALIKSAAKVIVKEDEKDDALSIEKQELQGNPEAANEQQLNKAA